MLSIKLRNYQLESIEKINKTKDNFLVISPTGSGKTEIFIEIIKQNKDKKILLIVNRLVLLDQTIERLSKAGIESNIFHNSNESNIFHNSNVYISTCNTLYKRNKLDSIKFDLIIIDEVHHIVSSTAEKCYKKDYKTFKISELNISESNKKEFALLLGKDFEDIPITIIDKIKPTMLQKIISKHPESRIIGFTATHQKDNSTIKLKAQIDLGYIKLDCEIRQEQCICSSGVFGHNENNLYYKSVKSLMDEGYLCKPNFKVWETGFFESDMITDVSYQTLFSPHNDSILSKIIDEFTQNLNKKIVVFLPNIEALNVLSKKLKARRIHHESVHIQIPQADQAKILDRFKTNETNLLLNCSILTEGYDNHLINKIVILRACRSNILFLQMIGRGLRLNKDEPDKICEVFDYSQYHRNHQNLERFEIYRNLLDNPDWNKCYHKNVLKISQAFNSSEEVTKKESITKYHFKLLEVGCFTIEDIFNEDFKSILKYYKMYNIRPTEFIEDKMKNIGLINPYLTPINERYSFACINDDKQYLTNREFFLYDHKESILHLRGNKTLKANNLKKEAWKNIFTKTSRSKEPKPQLVENLKKDATSFYIFENEYDIKNLTSFFYIFNKYYKWV